MSFLHPWAFLGLLSLPAIIALHWHFERQKRVIVSSMVLWQFLDEKFQGRKISFLHISWLLLLDLLIALLLTLALARPVVKLPSLGTSERQQIILLDDSASMLVWDAWGGRHQRFLLSQEETVELISQGGNKTESVVITFGGKAELVGSTIEVDVPTLANKVFNLAAADRGVDLRGALSIVASLSDPKVPQKVIILTDGAFPLPPLDDFPFEIEWRFVGEGGNNQAVLDLALEGGGEPQSELFFRVANYTADQVTREIEVVVDGKTAQSIVLALPPNSITPQTLALTAINDTVTVRLLGTDDMPADDSAVIGVSGSGVVRVAVVAENPYPLDRAVSTIPGTSLRLFTPSQFIDDGTWDLVIYRGMVPAAWPRTTVLVIDPPPTTSVIPVGTPVRIEQQPEVVPGSILAGAGLETVRWEYAFVLSEEEGFEALASSADLPFILRRQTSESDVYLFAPLLDAGNFTKHPAFPILLSRFVSLARDFTPQPSYQVGEVIDLPPGEFSIQAPSGELVEDGVTSIHLTEPGLYRFEATDELGEVRDAVFGVNLGDAQESDIAPLDWRTALAGSEEEAEREWQLIEIDLSPWLLAAAILLLLIEAWRAWR